MSAEESGGHPGPESEETPPNEIPEDLAQNKGEGDEGNEAAQATHLL